jgi:4-amino-4-deoxy-L-arabinose transferase-like glycosyltransferase
VDTDQIPLRGLASWARTRSAQLLVGSLLLVGMAMRLSLLAQEPLHQDEALYGFWGRLIASGQDVQLTTVPVDKPPLVPYLIAGSHVLFGVSEYAVRLPSLAASILAIPLTYVLAARLYSDRIVSVLAAAVMAVSPYPVLMGATAFTDPVLVVWWLLSCWCSLGRRWACAGFTLGLGFASKQHAAALAPLVLGLGMLGYSLQQDRSRWYAAITRFSVGLLLGLIPVFVWDALRQAGGAAVGFWSTGVASYGGLRLIRSPELATRFEDWLRLHGYVFAWPWFGVLVFVGVVILLELDIVRWRKSKVAVADMTLICFAIAYVLFHWLLAFPVWDRYLYPLVPVFGLLLGRCAAVFFRALKKQASCIRRIKMFEKAQRVLLCLVFAVLLGGGLGAVLGQVPVGGDHGAYDGLVDVVAFLQTLPVGTVLYDRWLSWHYDFYLFGAYLYRAGFPDPEWLAADAAAFYENQRHVLVVPSWESPNRLQRALLEHGLQLSPLMLADRRDGSTSFVVYEIGTSNDGSVR